MYDELTLQARTALAELLEQAALRPSQLVVVGCSSSEVVGARIGKGSSMEAARAIHAGIAPLLQERGLYLAAQCCEHLNRALVVERELAEARGYEIVNAIPAADAGGSFAVCAYAGMRDPVLVEGVRAEAGMDIGATLIGMHLRAVAVPVRVSLKQIGQAWLVCARTRPRYVGGPRAAYPAP